MTAIKLRRVEIFLLGILAFLLISCGQFGSTDIYAPNPDIEITAFPCGKPSENNQPLDAQAVFSTEETVCICAFQQKGGKLFLTIEWQQITGGYFRTYTHVQTNDGWFYPTLNLKETGFSEGTYQVRILAGSAIQATTEFEVIE